MYNGLVSDIKVTELEPSSENFEDWKYDKPDGHWDNGAKTFKTIVE